MDCFKVTKFLTHIYVKQFETKYFTINILLAVLRNKLSVIKLIRYCNYATKPVGSLFAGP